MGALGSVLASKRIVVCVGSGGVGKTTTAAALALESALRGRKTLVLTIDPAKRLANALGLEALDHEIQEVPPELLTSAANPGVSGSLHAMMLDQQQAFDDLVEEHASDPEAISRIMANPVYQQIAGSLAGSQEYAALAVLHDLDRSGDWDLIVVDTPPTAHALDFLDAPQKLTQAIDSPAIDWFRRLRGDKGGGWSIVGKTGAYILKRLAKFVGAKFIEDLGVFFTEFDEILGGFRQRAKEVFKLLRQERVGFVLVASPEKMAVREALFFYRRLVDSAMPLAGFVINRVHETAGVELEARAVGERLAAVDEVAALGLQPGTVRMAAEAIAASHREQEVLARVDAEALAHIRRSIEPGLSIATIPQFEWDVHSLDRLAALGSHVYGD